MPKWNTRIEFEENSYYHIYNRGLWKQIIFHNKKEFNRFYKLLIKYSELYKNIKIISYSILPNHFHFVVYNKEKWYNLSDFMKKIQWSYAIWYRILYSSEFKQPVFEWRFKAKLINCTKLVRCVVNFHKIHYV
jgi:hypothetical protein